MKRLFWGLLYAVYVLLLAGVPVIIGAQESSTTKSTSLPETTLNLQPIWTQLDKLLTELSFEALAQNEDLQKLSIVLEQSKTEISELQSLLKQSEQQLSSLEQSLKTEQKLRKTWETAAKIEIGIIIGLLLFGIVGWIL